MAYINRLSDINNKLDISIENQTSTNNKLTNIDDNIETIRILNNNINNNFNNVFNNNTVDVNVVSGLSSDGKAYLYDGDGTTAITYTSLSSTHKGIDTASALYITNGTTRTALSATDTSLNVNISNASIPVTGTFYPATQPVSGTINIKDSSGNNLNSTSNALNSYITNTSIPVTGTFYQATQPISGTVNSQLKDGSGNSITSTANALDINVKSGSIAISSVNIKDSSGNDLNSTSNALNNYITNGSTTNSIIYNAGTGLNMYVIPSKTKTFLFNAYSNSSLSNGAISFIGGTQTFSSNNWGLANTRTWYAIRTGSTPMSLTYTYVNGSGNEIEVSTPLAILTGSYVSLGTGIVTINKWAVNTSIGIGDTLYIGTGNTTGNYTQSWCGANYYIQSNSLWTCPNNCIAWVQNISIYFNATDSVRLFKWDYNGNRSIMYGWLNSSNFNSNATGEYGFGGYITAGETIGWGAETSGVSARNLFATIVCRYM